MKNDESVYQNTFTLVEHGTSELPRTITNSFPPRGIVAKILNSSTSTKGKSLHFYGSYKEHFTPNTFKTKTKIEEAAFSLPQTLTEKTFKTRKTPRFYTVDTSSLRQQSNRVDQALDQLVTNPDLTGLQDIYQRICKGSITTLKTLISKKKISQNFVFVQNSSPLNRHHKETKLLTARDEEQPKQLVSTADRQYTNRERTTSRQLTKRVLVPSPYFRSQNEKTSLSNSSSQHILYGCKFDKNCRKIAKRPIEATVIDLNEKLPELGNRRLRNSGFPHKNSNATPHP